MMTLLRLIGIVAAGFVLGIMLGLAGYLLIYLVITVFAWLIGV